MEEPTLTLIEVIEWSQDPIQMCAGSPVIPARNFQSLAEQLISFKEITKTSDEIVDIFKLQSKRFAACGANFSDKHGVVRKNPKTGWNYLVTLLTEKEPS